MAAKLQKILATSLCIVAIFFSLVPVFSQLPYGEPPPLERPDADLDEQEIRVIPVPPPGSPRYPIPVDPYSERFLPGYTLPRNVIPRTSLPRNEIPRIPLPRYGIPRNVLPRYEIPRSPLERNAIPRTPLPRNQIPRNPLPRNQIPRNPI